MYRLLPREDNIMTKTWFISDLLLGDASLLQDGKRKRGYEGRILKAWSHIVHPNDTIYLLGNVAVTRQAYWLSRIADMPGNKILLKGELDKNRDNWYRKFGFTEIVPFAAFTMHPYYTEHYRYDTVVITHLPADTSVALSYDKRYIPAVKALGRASRVNKSILNIHGHTRGQGRERYNTFDVGVDAVGEYPIELEQIIERKFK